MDTVTTIRRYDFYNRGFSYWGDVTSWCFKQFGVPSDKTGQWHYTTTTEYMDFHFKNSEDAVLFTLRW